MIYGNINLNKYKKVLAIKIYLTFKKVKIICYLNL